MGGLKIEDEAEAFSQKVMDLTQFLMEKLEIKIPYKEVENRIKVTYHDPCHTANARELKGSQRASANTGSGI